MCKHQSYLQALNLALKPPKNISFRFFDHQETKATFYNLFFLLTFVWARFLTLNLNTKKLNFNLKYRDDTQKYHDNT